MNYKFIEDEAGSDESGKGDFFGGIAVCVFYLNSENYELLQSSSLIQEISDSKNISNSKIKKIAPKILDIFRYEYSYVVFNAEEYNEMYKKFNNLNILLSFIHNLAWTKLKKEKDLDNCHTIIDEFVSREKYNNYLKNISCEAVPIKNFCVRAETRYLSCAIASIIARFFYIQQIEAMRAEYGIKIPFGNSYNPHNSVVDVFLKLSKQVPEEEILKKLCKNHFKTVRRIKKAQEIMKLPNGQILYDSLRQRKRKRARSSSSD